MNNLEMRGWVDFVRHFNIPHRDRAKNVEIHCCFCGTADKSFHMGLRKQDSLFGCFRNKQHSGKNPTKVIAKLLNINWDEAEVLTRQFFGFVPPVQYIDKQIHRSVIVPEEFKPFVERVEGVSLKNNPTSIQDPKLYHFGNYLFKRGLDPLWVVTRYDLRYCTSSEVPIGDRKVDYSNRIIIPVRQNNEWFSWTARTINPSVNLRYKAHVVAPSKFLFDQDNLRGGRVLVVTEGPFDAMKVASCFLPGIHATSLFGKIITTEQINLLMKLSDSYESIVLAFDRDSYSDALREAEGLSLYVPNLRVKSPEHKDYGTTPLDLLKPEISAYAERVK